MRKKADNRSHLKAVARRLGISLEAAKKVTRKVDVPFQSRGGGVCCQSEYVSYLSQHANPHGTAR